jgi:hypothetical protein|tara:strand:+ start:184 stop:414 length:231 start_codon:yes stop_codon:yes gene_type:complete
MILETIEKAELILKMPICSTCKIDKLFEIDCYMYTNLGTDSSKKERAKVKKTSTYIYKLIKGLNNQLGKELLYYYA